MEDSANDKYLLNKSQQIKSWINLKSLWNYQQKEIKLTCDAD